MRQIVFDLRVLIVGEKDMVSKPNEENEVETNDLLQSLQDQLQETAAERYFLSPAPSDGVLVHMLSSIV